MLAIRYFTIILFVGTLTLAGLLSIVPARAAEPANAAENNTVEMLLQKLQTLEQRVKELEQEKGISGSDRAAATSAARTQNGQVDPQEILDRLTLLEERLSNLETTAVLSEPKTTVKQVEVYVDENGNQYDEPVPGAKPVTTYRRTTAYRRQVIGEEIEEALAAADEDSIHLGVSSVTTAQMAFQTRGIDSPANGHIYGLSAADVTFLANSAALNTMFFADLVGIGGSPPDQEIMALNLLNSQGARLSNNQLSLREAWIRTELLQQRLAISVGRLDLTNYFDENAVANDETSQFISDVLVNNPILGLSENGLGIAAVYDPRGPLNFRVGVQQSNSAATSFSTSLFTLGQVEYVTTPFSLPEGHYRVWFRLDNTTGDGRTGYGVSFDQRLTPAVTVFGRYGFGFVEGFGSKARFFSGGVGFNAPLAFNPLDTWGIGYAQTNVRSGPDEKIAELFYNLHVTERLALSFMLQFVLESQDRGGFILPGTRLAVDF